MRRHGFSLIEVLLAIFILGIGAISIASLFPVGIAQQRSSFDDVMGPIVADNALSLLRARLEPGDFGVFSNFGNRNVELARPPLETVPGDWPWLRPGFVLKDDVGTAKFNGEPYDERGSIDIFSYRFTRRARGLPQANTALATEFPPGLPDNAAVQAPDRLYGIPYNAVRYTFDTPLREPRFTITQKERYYPMVSGEGAGSAETRPLYVWDCMFRRYQGRIHVAIFVYRVTIPGGGRAVYATPPNPLSMSATIPAAADRPPLPYLLDLTDQSPAPWPKAWDAYGINDQDQTDDMYVRGTPADEPFDPRDPAASWQKPGQWLLNQNNTVHRVLSRTRRDVGDEALVELLRPVLPVSLFDESVSYIDRAQSTNVGVENVVTHLWYIPSEIELDTDGDGAIDVGASVTLTPVYAVVREL
jgi:prepilin-type N-terminal cleavage/methylation domain-containing protein